MYDILCMLYYVYNIMYSVLCTMYGAWYVVYYVWCTMYYVYNIMYYVWYTMYYVCNIVDKWTTINMITYDWLIIRSYDSMIEQLFLWCSMLVEHMVQ